MDKPQRQDGKTAKDVLALRLKTLMRERGVNRKKIETGTGNAVSARTVGYMVEAGDFSNPTLETLMAVAEYFGIQVWELLFDPDVDTPKLMERGLTGRVYRDTTRQEPKIGTNVEADLPTGRRRGVG